MRKLIALPILGMFLLAVVMTGCGGKDKVANDPKAVVVAFFERMANKDMDGAAKLATKDSKGTIDMMKKAIDAAEKMKGAMKDMKQEEEDPVAEFKNMEFGEAKIDGDNATVAVMNKKKNETIEFPLKKEGGSWKVDFSMATLMKMGMDKNKEENDMNMNDVDTTGGMQGLENINADSLKKGLEMADSMLKQLNPEKLKEMMKEN